MQKTIKEWLSELPEPYRSKALEYNKVGRAEIENVDSLEMAIVWGFPWGNTLEGPKFWVEVSDGKLPYCPTKAPTCAIEALHAIALKKGFAVEDIESIEKWREHAEDGWWKYRLHNTNDWHIINLKTTTDENPNNPQNH